MSLLMLLSDDIWVLINYMSFVQWLSVGASISSLIYLRWKKPDIPRPIKVSACTDYILLNIQIQVTLHGFHWKIPTISYSEQKTTYAEVSLFSCIKGIFPFQFNIAIPVTFMIVVVFLLIVPLYAAPYDTGMGLLCVVSGIPVYIIGVAWKNKPKVFNDYMGMYIFHTLYPCLCVHGAKK